ATFTIERDGAPLGLEAELVIDGRTVTCPVPSNGVGFTTCDADVSVSAYERQTCSQQQTSDASCVGTGHFVQEFMVRGTPATVATSLRSAGPVVAERVFQPSYDVFQPGGPQCGPGCKYSGNSWTLP